MCFFPLQTNAKTSKTKKNTKYYYKTVTTKKYLGKYKITHYCACSRCCGKWANGYTASGTKAKAGRTIGVDPNVIPYGTKMYIKSSDGSYIYGYAVAADTGSFTKSRPNNVDLFMSSKATCTAFGRRNVEIYILE